MKLYFEFLEQISADYREVNLELFSEFIGWLKNPLSLVKVVPFKVDVVENIRKRKPVTINTIISTVLGFYDHLIRLEDFENDIVGKSFSKVSGRLCSFI